MDIYAPGGPHGSGGRAERAAAVRLEHSRAYQWIERLKRIEVPEAVALMRREEDGATGRIGHADVARAYGEHSTAVEVVCPAPPPDGVAGVRPATIR